jgi:hypothetical protein
MATKSAALKSTPLRSEKLDLRLTPGAKQTLQRAAAITSSVPWSGVNPPAPHAGLASMGGASQASGSGWCCKRWAGPFPWFESYLNQTNHAQDPLCRT